MPTAFFSPGSPGASGRLIRLGCRTAAGLVAAGAVVAAAPSPARPSPARPSPWTPPRGAAFSGGGFNGVSSASATDAWAVGAISTENPRTVQGLVAHWDGTNWSRVPVPHPGPQSGSTLNGVSAASASDVWAVGYTGTPPGLSDWVLHWNGTRWSRVPSPTPAGGADLNGVSAVSASDVWAVGSDGTVSKTLAMHWDGTGWTRLPTPSPGGVQGSRLLGVASAPDSGAWAVGCYGNQTSGADHTLVLRWTGAGWTRVPAPSPGAASCLSAVTAVSASDAWAVGRTAGSAGAASQTLVLHWDGARWTQVTSPSPPGGSSELNAVSALCSSRTPLACATSAWAVGEVVRNQVSQTLILNWNGTRWRTVASPSQGPSVLNGVSDVSGRDALAAGFGGTGSLALHWNGSRWVIS